MPKLTETQRTALHAAIHAGGSYQDIAARIGVSANTVTYHARLLGYAPRRRSKRPTQVPAGRVAELLAAAPTTVRHLPWMERGACRYIDEPDVMYPQYERDTDAAKAVCAGCPVKQICADWAISTREPHGVWGGLTERDRLNLTRGVEEATAC